MQRIKIFHQFFSGDIVDLKKLCNLIDQEHIDPYPRSQNFPKYEIYPGIQQLI